MFNFVLILNLNNNVIISKQHVIPQFITYSIYHLYTISITIHDPNIIIYHTNLIQNTNKSYKNVSHNTGSKIPQTVHIIIRKELPFSIPSPHQTTDTAQSHWFPNQHHHWWNLPSSAPPIPLSNPSTATTNNNNDNSIIISNTKNQCKKSKRMNQRTNLVIQQGHYTPHVHTQHTTYKT